MKNTSKTLLKELEILIKTKIKETPKIMGVSYNSRKTIFLFRLIKNQPWLITTNLPWFGIR